MQSQHPISCWAPGETIYSPAAPGAERSRRCRRNQDRPRKIRHSATAETNPMQAPSTRGQSGYIESRHRKKTVRGVRHGCCRRHDRAEASRSDAGAADQRTAGRRQRGRHRRPERNHPLGEQGLHASDGLFVRGGRGTKPAPAQERQTGRGILPRPLGDDRLGTGVARGNHQPSQGRCALHRGDDDHPGAIRDGGNLSLQSASSRISRAASRRNVRCGRAKNTIAFSSRAPGTP